MGTRHPAGSGDQMTIRISAFHRALLELGMKPGDRLPMNAWYALLEYPCGTLSPAQRNRYARLAEELGLIRRFGQIDQRGIQIMDEPTTALDEAVPIHLRQKGILL